MVKQARINMCVHVLCMHLLAPDVCECTHITKSLGIFLEMKVKLFVMSTLVHVHTSLKQDAYEWDS
jgi:hypothetical protein